MEVNRQNNIFGEDALDKEITLLLEAVYENYGYDFRQYSRAHVKRRIMNRMSLSGIKEVGMLKKEVLENPLFASHLLQDLSITVTEMFRDPKFYKSLRENIIPRLKTYPFITIWHAGCSTGEEAYSMAIILKEEGLYERTTIYATDFNQKALNLAKTGIYPNRLMKDYTSNYQMAGGRESFGNYYTADYEMAIMANSLKKNIVWANHNLVTDAVFAEVHLVLCRNVLIYFNRNLQNQVHGLFFDSLVNGGFLCLGAKEGLNYGEFSGKYSEMDRPNRIFRKKY